MRKLKTVNFSIRGFTLVEIIIVCAITGVILSIGSLYLGDISLQKNLTIEAEKIVFSLRIARDKSIMQEDRKEWGIHFDGTGEFYEMFSGPAYVSGQDKKYIGDEYVFISPASGDSFDIIFEKMTGSAQATNAVIIALKNKISVQKTISVAPNGEIEY